MDGIDHLKPVIENSIFKFIDWLKGYGEYSYDRMDFNSSKIGLFTKKILYKNKYLGFPFASLALLQETFTPELLKLYAVPRREAIGDAHYASGFLNLYEITGDNRYLAWAEHYLDELQKSSIKGYTGICWGYTFNWQTSDGIWPPGIPFITVTPYGFWAFKKHYEITGSGNSFEICRSISVFAMKDLLKQRMPNGTYCSSYSPNDNRYVINANTYRAALLYDAFKLFNNPEYLIEADQNIEFVLSYQESDGKWYYEAIGSRDRFIDNFHTCFVLRNLGKCYAINKDNKILSALQKGYDYYRKYLFRPDHTPIHLSEIKYNKLRKYEMYDYAEGIVLGCFLDSFIPGSLDFSKILAMDLINRFQLKDGHFVTRVTSLGNRNTIPYHRWPQAQLFNSLTEILKKLQ